MARRPAGAEEGRRKTPAIEGSRRQAATGAFAPRTFTPALVARG